MIGKYFNDEGETDSLLGTRRLSIVESDGFSVLKGFTNSGKPRDVIAYCETREEAEKLVKILCSIN